MEIRISIKEAETLLGKAGLQKVFKLLGYSDASDVIHGYRYPLCWAVEYVFDLTSEKEYAYSSQNFKDTEFYTEKSFIIDSDKNSEAFMLILKSFLKCSRWSNEKT